MNIAQFNYYEAALWASLALGLAISSFRLKIRAYRCVLLISAGTFILFGVSDIIEAHTGAWWRPIELLMLKGFCILVFALLYRRYKKIKKAITHKMHLY